MIELDNLNEPQSERSSMRLNSQIKEQNRSPAPIRALLCKSLALQRKSVFTNCCQITTPLICLLFTLVVQQIVQDKVVSKIGSLPYPQPLNIPGLLTLVPQFNLTCKEFYLYQSDPANKAEAERMLNRTLSAPCRQSGRESPYFVESKDINGDVMSNIREADTQTFVRNADLKANIPDGVIRFNKVSQQELDVELAINDLRLPEYHRSNGVTKIALRDNATAMFNGYLRVTQGELSLMDLVTRAYLSTYSNKEVIMTSVMYMPFSGEDRTLFARIVNVIGSGLYPLGLSLLFPVFLYAIVAEKEERLLENMKTNGLTMGSYWIVTFGYNLALSAITFTVFYVFGREVLELSYFTETSFQLMVVIMVGWAISQVSLANLVQVFISKAKSATVIGYVIAVFVTLVGEALSTAVFALPMKMPICTHFHKLDLRLYPGMSLCRLFYRMAFACSNGSCFRSLDEIDDEMVSCILVLYGGVLLFPLSIYIHEVVQQEYGVKKGPLYFLQSLRRALFGDAESYASFNPQVAQSELEVTTPEDEGVKEERLRVASRPRLPLVISAIDKKYPFSNGKKDYTAVKSISFTIRENQIFGLLGPNGAGKTSLISVLTGLYPPTGGDAWMEGLSIRSDMDRIRLSIGVCPQFDLLWKELSPQEHLYFYARLKGIPQADISRMVDEALQEVDLIAFRHLNSERLSGGMKRRLSIAIALVGNPSLVFLDQPSSGLDPQHRRSLWNILIKCRKRRSILLTTHSMEEADTLCNRIGIITEGTLRCVGSQTELKLKYGSGYNLTINLRKGDAQTTNGRVERLHQFVEGCVKITRRAVFNSNVVYKLKKEENPISKIFRELTARKSELEVEDWSITQPSLYDVFIKVVETEQLVMDSDADAM